MASRYKNKKSSGDITRPPAKARQPIEPTVGGRDAAIEPPGTGLRRVGERGYLARSLARTGMEGTPGESAWRRRGAVGCVTKPTIAAALFPPTLHNPNLTN